MATLPIRYPDSKSALLAEHADNVFGGRLLHNENFPEDTYTKLQWVQKCIEEDLRAAFMAEIKRTLEPEGVDFGTE